MTRHGLDAVRYSKQEMLKGKTPDFKVFKAGELILFCEAKHVQSDAWVDDQLEVVSPMTLVGGLRHDPVFNRIAGHIHKALKQLTAVNQDRKYPNALIFANSDDGCGFQDLLSILTGDFFVEGGRREPIYRNISDGRIRLEKGTIDLYVWFDEWKGPDQKGSFYFYRDSPHYALLCGLLNSDPTAHKFV